MTLGTFVAHQYNAEKNVSIFIFLVSIWVFFILHVALPSIHLEKKAKNNKTWINDGDDDAAVTIFLEVVCPSWKGTQFSVFILIIAMRYVHYSSDTCSSNTFAGSGSNEE